jgi:hypothetical protein
MPDLALRQSVFDLLQNFRGLKPLKDLFWSELNYERVNEPLSRRNWPAAASEVLAEDPLLFAAGGSDGEFHVVYVRLASNQLLIGDERPVIAQLLRDHPYALFVVSNRAQDRWHFVNVKVAAPKETEENRDPQKRRLFRRITVAPGERLRTAAERLSMLDLEEVQGDLLGVSALAIQARHDEAFDVEAVTRQFYRRYREVFEQVEGMITGFGSEKERKRLFTQRLFNRLMFIAFIQKKGWLKFKGETDYLDALWRDYQKHRDAAEDENFYRDRLALLFFSGLNTPSEANVIDINRGGMLRKLIGEVPYLNGGLFEEDEDDRRSGVKVPDRAIAAVLRDLLARFNFTVTESTPLDVEVAVDPEMLGKVFEELVTGRHESGSYYTPKPIVSFMCREGLKGYLQTAAPDERPEAIARFVDEHEPSGLRNPEAVLDALKEVRVCDPACGSGAYLLGMLHELLELRAALFAVRKLDPVSAYQRKLQIIQNNVYGVDIDPFAVNIARLRLWLSLAVDFQGERPEPLPNLDFKIEQGDSLAAPRIQQLDLASEEAIHRFEQAKAAYMTGHHGSKRVARQEVDRLRTELTAWLHGGGQVEGFDWWVEFAEVFLERHAPVTMGGELNLGQELVGATPGGFDIIVANPPYVRMELFKEQKPTLRRNFPHVHADRADLYVYFYSRALELLAAGGMLVFISSNKWFRAGYGANLRKYIAENSRIWSITDFGELPVFENAATFPMIFVAQKEKPGRNGRGPVFTQVKTLDPPYPDVSALIEAAGQALPREAISGPDWMLSDTRSAAVMTRMEKHGVPLSTYVGGQIYWGIKTGLNKAFVIDGATGERLIRKSPRSAEVIKPLAVGDDVRKWRIERKDKWLLYMYHGVDVRGMEAVLEHLRPYRDQLEGRATRQQWYELQQPQMRYKPAFEQTKIIYPEIAKESRFAFDEVGVYPNNKAFFIPVADLYLLGLLNSTWTWNYLKNTCSVLGDAEKGGRLELRAIYMEKLPIPQAGVADRKAITELVQKCLDVGGKGPQVAEWEAEIDDRVAALYGLKAAPARTGTEG